MQDNTTKGLFKKTAIYGIGSVITQAGSLLLIPFYAHYLQPADYGILATAAIISMSLEILLSLRLESAFMRSYFDVNSDQRQLSRLISCLFYAIVSYASVMTAFMLLVGQWRPVSSQINGVPFHPYLELAILSAYFSALGVVPMTLLRVQQKAVLYISINLCQFLVKVAFTLYFVAILQQGAAGSLRGTLIGSITFAFACIVLMVPYLRRVFDWQVVREALSYSLPLLPNAVSFWSLKLSDRLILGTFMTLSSVGIYSFGYNIGSAMAIVVSSFTASWTPLFFDAMKSDKILGARRLGQIATHVLVVLVLVALAGALISREVIMLLAPPQYYGAAAVVPWIILAYLFHGVYVSSYNILSYFKKIKILPLITAVAAIINISANLVLVPRYGYIAAAWNTALGYFISALLAYIVSNRLLKLEINWRQLGCICALSCAVFFFAQQIETSSATLSIAYKGIVYLIFLALLFGLKILPLAILEQVPLMGKLAKRAPKINESL